VTVTVTGTWAGHFGRDHCTARPRTPELFLYSTSDYYLSHQYLESAVLGLRVRAGTPYRAVRFEDSPHVGHLRVFRDKYIQGSYINEDGKSNKVALEISVVLGLQAL